MIGGEGDGWIDVTLGEIDKGDVRREDRGDERRGDGWIVTM